MTTKSPLRDIYKEEFKKILTSAVGLHKHIGFRQDHPSWLQYKYPISEYPKKLGLDLPSYEEQRKEGNIILFFKSSQCDFHVWFTIADPTQEEINFLTDYNSGEAYEYFRTIKYEILNELDYGNSNLEGYGNARRNGTFKEYIQQLNPKTKN